jgi:tetratricopeptide (TPR) repeat protein
MVCPSCGASNPENVTVCTQCGRGVTEADDSQTFILETPAEAPARAASAGAMSWGTIHSQPGAAGASQFAPGSNFGRYRIEALLGEGGMGAVYRAFDTELNRLVALKLVRPELATSPQTMQRFKQELLLASRISHKNVLRIHDLGDWNGVKFISMALVEGRDLASLLEHEGRLPMERGLRFARQLCAALEAAHGEGVVHRDLKPQNILIDGADHVYISDFGLAKSLEAGISMGTRTGQILGTPRYMSPEQVEAKEVDARSDLYSLGLIFYEMFTGETPFRGDSAMQLMYQRVTERPRHPRAANPEMPEYLANLILKCLEKDPAKRYRSAAEVLADLDAQRAPARAGIDTISIRIPRPTRRGAAIAMGAIALAAGALITIPAARNALRGLLPGANRTAAQPAIRHYLAILPLNIAGDESSLRYLAEGLADTIAARLGGLHDVYVASNVTPAVSRRPDDQIASALGVSILVRGTISGAGDQVSITLKADDVKSRRTLMNQAFQGVRKDFLAVEDQVFNTLVNSLVIQRSADERARTTLRPSQSIEAYDLYLQGKNLLRGNKNLDDAKKALTFFDRAIKLDAAFALAYAGTADALVRTYEETHDRMALEQAEGAAEQAMRLNNQLPEVHNSLGTIYAQTGRTAGAIAEVKRALELAPNSDEGWRRLGLAYEKAGQRDREIEALEEAVRINPYYARNYNALGDTYFDTGQNRKALEMYQKVVSLAPDNSVGWGNRGSAYYGLGRLDDCVADYRKAISLSPKANYYSRLGVAYFYLGRFPEATAAFETAAQKQPSDAQIRVNLADSYRISDERDKADAAYDAGIRLAFASLETNAKDAAAMGILATAYAKKGRLAEASRFIRQARQVDPRNNDLMYREATIHVLAGEAADALRLLREAVGNGYPVFEAKTDPEWKTLRDKPEFAAAVGGAAKPEKRGGS